MKRLGVILLTIGALWPAGAQADVLYDQMQTPAPLAGPVSSRTGGPNDFQPADDFTVPPGQLWQLSSIDLNGTSASGDTMLATIYLDSNGVPGPEFAHQDLGPGQPAGDQTYPVNGLGIPPGHFWLSMQGVGSVWDWFTVTPIRGSQAVYRQSNAGPCQNAFKPLPQCFAGDYPDHDMSFRLNGSSAAPTAPIAEPRKKKCKKKKKHRSAFTAKKKHRKCKKHKHKHH